MGRCSIRKLREHLPFGKTRQVFGHVFTQRFSLFLNDRDAGRREISHPVLEFSFVVLLSTYIVRSKEDE